MALSGSFYNYPVQQFGLYCEWTGAQNRGGNYTTITLNVYLRYYTINVGARDNGSVNIGGTLQGFSTPAIKDMSSSSWHNVLLATKTQKVVHNANGTKTGVTLSASWSFNGTYSGTRVNTITASTTVDLDSIATYTLTTSAGTGSSITVNRTSSGYGATGNLNSGARLYYGDKLRITFTANANYALATHTVNNSTFTSGNTYTVSGNTSVASTAQVLASSVGATNANIGSVSTITVTKYNSSYYHSLQYSFGGASGYIKANGTTSSTEVRFSQASVAFTVPTSFYERIPNAKSGTCTITCRTYSTASSVGVLGSATTCTFTVTAPASTCSPTVTGEVVDTNAVTTALTGNSSTLIRYKSRAQCTITAIPNMSARISGASNAVLINNSPPSAHQIDPTTYVYTGSITISDIDVGTFTFSATDSRGYKSTCTSTPTIIPYIKLTCNPVVYRPSATGSVIEMTVSGDLFRGSLGAATNTLTLDYRYKEAGGTYGSWTTISSGIVYGTASYSSGNSAINLGNDFDYQKEYEFQIRARDGATVSGTNRILSTATKTVTIARGIPVFDWGEDDFNFNVPVSVNNERAYLVKYKDVTLSSVALTTQGANGVYYRSSGYSPTTDLGFTSTPTILGLTLLACTNVGASFVPYYNVSTQRVNFYSDVSQTVGTVVLRIVYV